MLSAHCSVELEQLTSGGGIAALSRSEGVEVEVYMNMASRGGAPRWRAGLPARRHSVVNKRQRRHFGWKAAPPMHGVHGVHGLPTRPAFLHTNSILLREGSALPRQSCMALGI